MTPPVDLGVRADPRLVPKRAPSDLREANHVTERQVLLLLTLRAAYTVMYINAWHPQALSQHNHGPDMQRLSTLKCHG